MEIYRRYGPALLRKARRMLGDSPDAEDLVQALFVDLLQKNQTDADLPYLYRAITNRCLNHMRDRKNRQRLLEAQDTALERPVRLRCDERAIGADALLKLSRQLDGKTWEVLVYRFVDDMGQQEIAELIGVSRKTVQKRLEKVRRAVATLGGSP